MSPFSMYLSHGIVPKTILQELLEATSLPFAKAKKLDRHPIIKNWQMLIENTPDDKIHVNTMYFYT